MKSGSIFTLYDIMTGEIRGVITCQDHLLHRHADGIEIGAVEGEINYEEYWINPETRRPNKRVEYNVSTNIDLGLPEEEIQITKPNDAWARVGGIPTQALSHKAGRKDVRVELIGKYKGSVCVEIRDEAFLQEEALEHARREYFNTLPEAKAIMAKKGKALIDHVRAKKGKKK